MIQAKMRPKLFSEYNFLISGVRMNLRDKKSRDFKLKPRDNITC